jgi:hypothetical protein
VSNDVRAAVAEQAEILRQMADRMAHHGVGERWQGPSRRECEAQLAGIHDDVRELSRRLVVASTYAGVHDVRAPL